MRWCHESGIEKKIVTFEKKKIAASKERCPSKDRTAKGRTPWKGGRVKWASKVDLRLSTLSTGEHRVTVLWAVQESCIVRLAVYC